LKNIIAKLFWQSPFEALHRHMLKVKECADMLKPLIEAFILGDRTLIEERVERISKLEHEADIIKNEIREHLPHHIFMPVDRSDILRFLREEDSIADSVEDVAKLIEMRKTYVPQDLKEELIGLVNKVGETVKALEIVTSEIKVLSQSSFSRPTSVLLLMRIMGEVGSVADHAQNTGDRLRCIIAR